MNTMEITRKVKEKLETCPNCEGKLEQIETWKIRCKSCGYDYEVFTLKSRIFSHLFLVGIACFSLGAIVVTFI